MDLTVYLFDSTKAVSAVITRGIVQLIHKERARALNAEIPIEYAARPGEYLGFACVDGRFRLVAIDYADDDDNTATTIITATDAAKDELTGTVIMVTEQESAAIGTAAKEMLTAAGWTLGLDETDGRTTAVEGGLRSAWDVLVAFETDGNLFIDPYYEFDGKAITGRVVDLLGKKPVYTGRLVQRGTDAENIVITRKNRPRPMIYPQGADGLTIADVVWSKEEGDPVDKPAGQLWIGVPEAVAEYPGQGQVYSVETDDPAELMAKGWEKAQATLADPEGREKVRNDLNRYWYFLGAGQWDRLLFLLPPYWPEVAQTPFQELCKKWGKAPVDCYLDVMAAAPDLPTARTVTMQGTMFHEQTMIDSVIKDPIYLWQTDSRVCTDGSDGPLVTRNNIQDYMSMFYFFVRYVRELGAISLEDAVCKATSRVASHFRLENRGQLMPGFYADVNVFALDDLKINATFAEPKQYCTGMDYVIVNGTPVIAEGRHTGARSGRVLRHLPKE